jgi:polyphosphate kinase 2 (PPK2 family)
MARGDLAERRLWDDYQLAYEEALTRCSTEHAPWHIIPSDRKWHRNIAAAQILVSALEAMDPRFPGAHFDPRTLDLD